MAKGTRPDRRGEKNGRAKLTNAKVADMRQRAVEGQKPAVIAARFGVSVATVSRVVRGRAWPHLPLVTTDPRQLEMFGREASNGR